MGVPYAEVIGDPIAHSKSPAIHKFWLERLGIEGEYQRTRVTAEELSVFLGSRRAHPDWRGCSVTIPHKEAIVPLLDDCRVWGIGAVNCVVPVDGRLIGHNTDMSGIGHALQDHVPTGAPVCIVGAGGAARAAVAELDTRAVFQFNVIARNAAKARAMAAPYGDYGRVFGLESAAEAIRNCVGLVNASPLGMDGFDPMPAAILDALSTLARRAFVLDMVYAPPHTELLGRATSLGFDTAGGLSVLIGQAAPSFELFFGVPAPREHDAELRELLTS